MKREFEKAERTVGSVVRSGACASKPHDDLLRFPAAVLQPAVMGMPVVAALFSQPRCPVIPTAARPMDQLGIRVKIFMIFIFKHDVISVVFFHFAVHLWHSVERLSYFDFCTHQALVIFTVMKCTL